MAIEAIYYRTDDSTEIRREKVFEGSVFGDLSEGKTPDGYYRQ